MEEGCHKSKRLSYTAEFKREVIRCAEEKGNRKAAAIFGVDESNVRLWRKHKAAGVRCHEENSLDPRKDNFLKMMMQSSRFFKRDTRLDCL
jgi:transposase-like protein